MTGFVYHGSSYSHTSDHCVKVGYNLLREIIKPCIVHSTITILHPALLQYNCLTLQLTRYKNQLFFVLVIHSLSQNSDCCTRHQNFGTTNFPCQILVFWTTFLYAFILHPSLAGEQNIKRRQKDNKKAPTPKGKCSLAVLLPLPYTQELNITNKRN